MRRLFLLAPLVLLAWSAVAWADSQRLADTIAPFVEDQTLGLVVMDMSRIDLKAVPEYFLALSGNTPAEFAEFKEKLALAVRGFRNAGGKQLIAVFSLADFPIGPYLLVPVAEATSAEGLEKLFKSDSNRARPARAARPVEAAAAPSRLTPFPIDAFAVEQRVGDVLFIGSEAAWKHLRDAKPAPRPELAQALAAVEGNPIRMVLLASPDTKRAFEENAPTLPKELGGGPITSVTRGVQWAALGVQLQPQLSLRLVVQSPDVKAARTLADGIDHALKAIGENTDLRQALGKYDALARKLSPEVHGSRLTLEENADTMNDILQPLAAHAARVSASRIEANGLKELGLAMHNYYDVHRTLPPPAIYSKDGKPLLSWRVALLPFLGKEKLYEQFHLDEPWDSEHNKKLIEKMPVTYRSLSRKAPPGKTVYQVVVGDATLFRGPKGVTFREVTDGTSNTIMVLQTDVAHALDWTRPEDIRDNPNLLPADVVGRAHKTFAATMADGAVRVFPTTIDPNMFRALLTRAGGETIDFSKLP